VARTLQSEGYEVLGAREGAEALRELEEIGGSVDLIITDLIMPGMGGVQLGRELSQMYPQIPLLWISGHPREVELPRHLPAMGHAFLMKPVAPDALIETVHRILDKARKA
jgi:two-component system cell cycle sensor histidine kinase/response regulator CckA